MDKEIVVQLHASFEDMVQKDSRTGTEFWCARDLQMLLGYSQWRNFGAVIDKAITACQNAGYDPRDHFAHVSKMVDLGSGAKRGESRGIQGNPGTALGIQGQPLNSKYSFTGAEE